MCCVLFVVYVCVHVCVYVSAVRVMWRPEINVRFSAVALRLACPDKVSHRILHSVILGLLARELHLLISAFPVLGL